MRPSSLSACKDVAGVDQATKEVRDCPDRPAGSNLDSASEGSREPLQRISHPALHPLKTLRIAALVKSSFKPNKDSPNLGLSEPCALHCLEFRGVQGSSDLPMA